MIDERRGGRCVVGKEVEREIETREGGRKEKRREKEKREEFFFLFFVITH